MDPNQIYNNSDDIAALSGHDTQVNKNYNTSNLCDLIKACSDERELNKKEMLDHFSTQNQGIANIN